MTGGKVKSDWFSFFVCYMKRLLLLVSLCSFYSHALVYIFTNRDTKPKIRQGIAWQAGVKYSFVTFFCCCSYCCFFAGRKFL
ncbi:hypothetical protein V1514DRAFT_335639 [Lipomyces japonicus]|uniref:uncharacterized protein n=1 Tax=Lipomyces japonicus TaxID=56871 RepID=UPI0034CD7C91